MAAIRFIFFILAVSVFVGLAAKYLILFLRRAKRTEEKVYDKLEKKILPKESDEEESEDSEDVEIKVTQTKITKKKK